ncbi:MAG: hypothetical protein WC895_01420 [Candidatus Shapirobacteria bacterium]|jgi:hypothetical protein
MPESFSHFDGVAIDHQEKSEQIKKPEQTLDSILNVELNIENINSYASDAFNKLVSFADKKVADYGKINSVEGLSYKDVEDAAFKYYKLENIDSILDYISDKSKEIRDLDKVIDGADKISNVIVQPDVVSQNISNNGNGEFKEKKMIDRLKTVLFILKEDFGVDLNDEDNFKIQKGIINKNMMRKTSYYLLNAPIVNRTILICDEEGNASYVFNSKKIAEKEINNDNLVNYTKSELNDLLIEDPEIGRRVVYSKEGFVPRIIDSIKNPISTIPDEISSELKDITSSYLYPKAPEDYLSINGIAEDYRIGRKTILKYIEDIKDQLGEVSKYRIRSSTVSVYSPEQQKIIKKYLKEKGIILSEAPEGYLPCKGIAEEFGITYYPVLKAIEDVKDQLGEVSKYKIGAYLVSGYSPEQQEIIKKHLEKRGLFKPAVPENYLSIRGISKELGLDFYQVSKAIEDTTDQLGEVSKYRFGSKITLGYSPEQQKIIIDYINNHKKK